MQKTIGLILAGLALALPAATVEANGKLCQRTLEAGFEFEEVLKRCLSFAMEGDTLAQATLSRVYNDKYTYIDYRDVAESEKWFGKAEEAWAKRAKAGDLEAAYRLGELHWFRSEGPEWPKPAVKWLRVAADKQHPAAQGLLGSVLLVLAFERNKLDPTEAAEIKSLLEKAVEGGYADAYESLGTLASIGLAGKADETEALQLYLKGAELGSLGAIGAVQSAYENGSGTKKDIQKAYTWAVVLALWQGLHPTEYAERSAPLLTKAQKAAATVEAKKIVERLESARHDKPLPPPAGTAKACRDGFVMGDGRRVIHECAPLAENGDNAAAVAVAMTYRGGYLENRKPVESAEKALKWYRLAAGRGDTQAMNAVGMMHYTGEGVAKDYAEAFWWLWLAAERGDSQAQHNLGALHLDEDVMPPETHAAYFWLKLAFVNGEERAVDALARIDDYVDEGAREHISALVAAWKPLPEKIDRAAAAAKCKAAYDENDGNSFPAAGVPCRNAAFAGDADSQAIAGFLQSGGGGGARSWRNAHMWLTLAIENGGKEAKGYLELLDLTSEFEPTDAHKKVGDRLAEKLKAAIAANSK